ncbi:Small GTP-binding protein domain protein [Trichormus variabilis ATCC 29413]|uniref:GTPase Obg n=2 Tax=Anabaena variabilis TaxID=264691 RepID=OBG_TRIV2|nr:MULTISPECIES: GTPase ObgE [Nostocaceae]Q3MCS7.1 RecName: Full=GTPase Obg; AltName: Full=GTP-binding protein Obg [Trichormus variabilis ATCC 29413]ABA21209.1 Small GTP-binding protein domain protein [Trichormus variabilis ATCC 29413]MBC1214140.1 GTPase ObgE [Trichormus variabilis ARAD]MBC1257363.1 GTPase ObgE [Trichormus variabilis V5]MBC1267803.1 GTPase ObgE [Trichormus variabilis FSR]MBC1303895.1 GTPase ObgE [Trichormus variabilis N2B]
MQFIDQAQIEVEAGKGGDGIVAFRREKYVPAGGPSGGNGGRGGSVVFVAVENLQTLLDFRYKHIFKADDGGRGGPNNCTGASGKDLIVQVPCGTTIYDAETGDLLGDLTQPNQQLLIAAGGKGGLGNQYFLSNRNRAPEYSLPGLPGERKLLRLELKLLAEVGIIGLPNAGKSTLISSLSAARPKIADYPFTTLIPNLGVVRKPTGDGTVFADIPGLIEGAADGAGLGHDFLRHIERTRVLLHLIDATSDDVIRDYNTIEQELQAYGRGLSERMQIVALNKIDAVDRETVDLDALATQLNHLSHAPVFLISAVTRTGLEPMLQEVWGILDQVNALEEAEVFR